MPPPLRFLDWFLGRIELQLLGPAGALDDAIAAASAAGAAQVSAPSLEDPGAFVVLSRERAEAAAGLRRAERLVFESVRVRVWADVRGPVSVCGLSAGASEVPSF